MDNTAQLAVSRPEQAPQDQPLMVQLVSQALVRLQQAEFTDNQEPFQDQVQEPELLDPHTHNKAQLLDSDKVLLLKFKEEMSHTDKLEQVFQAAVHHMGRQVHPHHQESQEVTSPTDSQARLDFLEVVHTINLEAVNQAHIQLKGHQELLLMELLEPQAQLEVPHTEPPHLADTQDNMEAQVSVECLAVSEEVSLEAE